MSNNALEQHELFPRVEALEQERDRSKQELDRSKQELDRLDQELDRLKQELDRSDQELDRLDQERDRLDQERDRLERDRLGWDRLERDRLGWDRLEQPKSVWRSGSESDNAPSKIGLEGVSPLSKNDPVHDGDFAQSNPPEIKVKVLIVRGLDSSGNCIIRLDRDATILELLIRVHQQTGVRLDQMSLFHDGRFLQDLWNEQDRLSANNINNNTQVTVVVRNPIDSQIYLPTTPNSTTNVGAKDEVQATSDGYDEDLYIVDPQAHFDMLSQLERNVLQRSEYYQTKREYSLSSALDPVDENGFFLDEIGLRPSLAEKIRRSSIMTQVSIHLVSIDILSRSPSKTLVLHLRDIPIGDCWLMASRQDRKTHPHLQHSGIS